MWSPSTKVNIDKIEMTQRRAARWVKSNYSSCDSVTEMLHDLGWRSLEQSKKISNDQELIQSDPISCPQNQKGNN